MVDISEFEDENHQSNGCQIGLLLVELRRMSPDKAAKLEAALKSKDIKHIAVSRVLRKWGFDISPNSVSYHRNSCRCKK